ncbi:MAG: hypothetical protein K0B08_09775, partial [Bacteroidales bacterium]|nr:hypothetical protein [Bacteroidales bacterium]
RFMRVYLYIPLGGNKVRPFRLYVNLWLVFLISGLWHGAAWNFVVWGAFHGLFLILDRLFLLKVLEKTGKIPAMAFTFFITLIGWVFFRADTLSHAGSYLKAMFSFTGQGQQVFVDQKFVIILALAVVFSFMAAVKGVERWQDRIFYMGRGLTTRIGFAVIFFILCLASVVSTGFNPFIYFRF